VFCSVLSMVAACCSHEQQDASNRTSLDCLHRDREICLLVTSINTRSAGQTATSGPAMSRASQVELDTEAILAGMHDTSGSRQAAAYPDQIE
jgi:hypothetical protein